MPAEKPTTLSARANDVTLDEMRLSNYRLRVKDQHETELRDIQAKNDAELTRTLEQHHALMEQLHRDYDVQISAQAQELDEKLQAQRLAGEERLRAEKAGQDKEFDRVRTQNMKRIEEYQKNSDARVEAVRKQEQNATASLHARARKLNQDKEVGST